MSKRVLDLTEECDLNTPPLSPNIDDQPELSPNLITEEEEEILNFERKCLCEMERAIVTYDITNKYIIALEKFLVDADDAYERHCRQFVIQRDRARAMRNRFQCYCHVNSAIERVFL